MSAPFAKLVFTFCCGLLLLSPTSSLNAQGGGGGGGGPNIPGNGNGFGGSVVGGISIDSQGVVSASQQTLPPDVRQRLLQGLHNVDQDINQVTDLRMISLRGLEAAITQSIQQGQPLPQDIRFMAGLQRIEYVILSPKTHDIILAGPGEGWKFDASGNAVGKKSGTPVIHLEDFLVAMRSVDNAREGAGISVSIDPTEEGVKRLNRLLATIKKQHLPITQRHQKAVQEAMGQHIIHLTGIPRDSRVSQILVGADYKMKRLSMGLEKAPIDRFPSFMEIAARKNVRSLNAAPRFWMECNYQPLAKTKDGTVWQLRGPGVKTLTQESHYDQEGHRKTTKKQNRFALQWANTMTERFEELSAAEPIFRELRNVMDMSVIAALIRKEQLEQKVGLELPAIRGLTDVLATPSFDVPKTVSTECSFVKLTGSTLISASGGIQVDSWGVVEKTETVPELAAVGTRAMQPTANRWWWNGQPN